MAKIILTQEVSGLGSAGDVIEVRDGYARNFLLPQGHAIAWTRGAEKEVESIKAARKARSARDLAIRTGSSGAHTSRPIPLCPWSAHDMAGTAAA